MLTQINNDKVKSLLHKIKSLVVDGRIVDCANYNKLLDELTVLSPTTAEQVNKEISYKPGWIFCGADFNALEARIDALTTKDTNKLAVYIDGMDSHSFNAITYWPDKMPNISKYLTKEILEEQHYRVEYSDGTFEYLPESLLNVYS